MAPIRTETHRVRTPGPASPDDALALLLADHRAIAALFEKYEIQKSTWRPDKKRLATDEICMALERHSRLEEEILYVAVRSLTVADAMIEQLAMEHEELRESMAQIGETEPDNPGFDDRVSQLASLFRRYVRHEEDGLFPAMMQGSCDLEDLGRRLREHKAIEN